MNVGLECSTHGMKTSKHQTPTYNPWNFNFKASDSHIQPMEWRPQTVQLPCPTHGMKASNHPTLMSNPWNEGLKPSDSHIQPMAWRPQTGVWYPWNKGFKPSDSHIQPMELPTLPNDDRHLVYPHTTSLFIHLLCWPVPCAYSMDDHINVPHPQLCQMMTGTMMPSMTC